jgi:hypothetical protein
VALFSTARKQHKVQQNPIFTHFWGLIKNYVNRINYRKCKNHKLSTYFNPLLKCTANNAGKFLGNVSTFMKHTIPRNEVYSSMMHVKIARF